MVSPIGAREAGIWLRGEGAARVDFWPVAEPGRRRRSALRRLGGESAVLALEGLEPATRYAGRVTLDDRIVSRFSFRTAPAPGTETELVIATGSCAFLNDEETDRPPYYGGSPRIFAAMAAARPDLVLWLGDNCYYRGADLDDETRMLRRQLRIRALPEVRPLLASSAQLAIWDDHDYGPNDSDGSWRKKELALRVFRSVWPEPRGSARGFAGVAFRERLGDVEIFATDDRYHRSPNEAADGPEKTCFGAAQFDWLIAGLAESDATFKIVVVGNQVLNPICRFEGMERYAFERERLLDEIARREIAGVLFLSGDRHHSEIIRRERAGRYALLDLTVSPLTSGTHGSEEKDNPARVPGSYLTEVRNFALLRFTGRGADRRLEVEYRDPDGRPLFATRIRAADLR